MNMIEQSHNDINNNPTSLFIYIKHRKSNIIIIYRLYCVYTLYNVECTQYSVYLSVVNFIHMALFDIQ